MLTRRSLIRLAGALSGALLLPLRAFAAQTVGSAAVVVNAVWAKPESGGRRSLQQAAPAAFGDTLSTGEESALIVRFIDNSQLTLGADAEAVIDEFVYAGANSSETLTLVKGAFRYISGQIPEEKIAIETPTVTIGVRGTDIKVDVYDDGSTEMSTVDGAVAVASRVTGEVLSVLTGQSVLSDAEGAFIGGVRDFIHRSADEAIERGVDELKSRLGIPGIPIPLPDLPFP